MAQTREQMALRGELAALDQKVSDKFDEVMRQNAQVLALLNAQANHR